MSKRIFLAIFLLCMMGPSVFLPYSSWGSQEITVKFATVAPEGSTWVKYMRALDKGIREKSNGKIGFRIYAGGVAGDELDVLRKIRIGQIHSAAFSGVGFGQILPMVRVLDLPFLFRSDQETDLVHRELEPFFSDQFRQKGFELIAWAEVGNVHLFSKKPIHRVDDLAELKIWTWSGDPISKKTFSMMGTNPIPLSITDVTTALNTGMIDTVYAPPLGAIALQWHTYLKCMTELPLAHSTGAVLISRKYYQTFPPTLAQLLREEFQKSMADLTITLRRQTEESKKILEKSGLQIIPLPQKNDLDEFYDIHKKVGLALAGEIYPGELLDRIYQILKRAP